jgi:hypothetical protein
MMDNPVTPLNPQQTAEREAHALQEPYLERVLVSDLDIPVNVATDGLPGETISSRWARWAKNYKGVRGFIGRWGSRMLNLFQHDHGADATAGDAARAQRVLETENESGIINQDPQG